MYNKYFILITILFICTSCERLSEYKMEKYSRKALNVELSLNNIPKNVDKYTVLKDSTSNNATMVDYGKVITAFKILYLKIAIGKGQNVSVELHTANGMLCTSRDVYRLIAVNITGKVRIKQECLNQEIACKIQVDFYSKCEGPEPVIIKVASPTRYKYKQAEKSHGSWNVAIWMSTAIVAALVIAGGIVLVRYKCCQLRNKTIVCESPNEVVYAEIDKLPCTSDKPTPKRDETPYANIIGVLRHSESASSKNVNLFNTFTPSTMSENKSLARQGVEKT